MLPKEIDDISKDIFQPPITSLLIPPNICMMLLIQREYWHLQSNMENTNSKDEIQEGDQISLNISDTIKAFQQYREDRSGSEKEYMALTHTQSYAVVCA